MNKTNSPSEYYEILVWFSIISWSDFSFCVLIILNRYYCPWMHALFGWARCIPQWNHKSTGLQASIQPTGKRLNPDEEFCYV